MKLLSNCLKNKAEKIRKPYGHSAPSFLSDFLMNFEQIKREFTEYKLINNSAGCAIDELSSAQENLNNDKKWESLILFGYGYSNENLYKDFPSLFRCIKKHDNVINLVMFSITKSGKIIPPHKGNNFGVLRLQIGIDIKESKKCFLRVEDKKIFLKEKETFIFDDTFEHELVNNSSFNRTVLIIDFLKPFPWPYNILNKIYLAQIAKSNYVQSVRKKLNTI